MKPITISVIMLLAVSLVLAGVLVAGCTQESGSSAPAATDNQQVTPAGTYAGNASYGGHQFSGQGFLTNETLMSSAAAQLGVPEQDLKNALTPTNGQRVNFTDAANQLGVTPDQLRAAFGFPAGSFHHGNQTMAMMTTAAGQ
ncbi:hypothetical protein [Methanoregula sp.]|uniref:hypothetical protein n=1 Tax=Methanoregula sp. TaxID=2052170 RepID=UPI002B91F104|nr:hypothetical protein [Methanoregula sp.]HVP96274.1 hypothetical protein [Methanoregula sp.]